jgi:oligopeptide/dipeptide ABC transporter ATP-binding protein
MNTTPVLEVENLVKHFPVGRGLVGSRGTVHAVDGVSFALREGEMLGLVGESGSGKTTLANCVVRLLEPTSGSIRLHGRDITHLSRRALRPLRRSLHMVFQDPFSSLNPRMRVGEIVAEPLRLHKLAGRKTRERRVLETFERVGLGPEHRFRYPHELSGGQRQRVGLARSLILEPSVLVADEPVSALDVSVQASILNLLRDLQRDMGFSCLFITHDLGTVEFLCDRIAVMYLGQLVEVASRDAIFRDPQHPYTQSLLSAALVPDPAEQRKRRRVVLEGDPPSPLEPPSGCRFHTRCPLHDLSAPACEEVEPPLREIAPGHSVACHLVAPGSRAPRIADTPVAEPVTGG